MIRAPARAQLVAVALVAFLVYARTLGHSLVWDDPALIEYATKLQREGGMTALLSAEFQLDAMSGESLGYYRPVVLLSLWLDSRVAAIWPGAFHATNVLLHVMNSILVLLLGRRVLRSRDAAFVAGLLFAIHPVHTESVAFVSGRTDLWATAFTLLATILWLGSSRVGGRRSAAMAVAGGAAFAVAALAKEVALLLPFVLLAWLLADVPADRSRVRGWRRAQWIAPFVLPLGVVAMLRGTIAGVGFGSGDAWTQGLTRTIEQPMHMLAVWGHYLRLLVIPWPLNAAHSMTGFTLSPASTWGATVWLAACAAAFSKRHERLGVAAMAWTVGFLLPVSGLLSLQATEISERFLYLPSVGFALVAGFWVDRALASARWRGPVLATSVAIGVFLSGATLARSDVWKNNITLFRDIARTSPTRALAHSNLGLEFLKLGRNEEAVAAFERALTLKPEFALAHTNLGLARERIGQMEAAVLAFERAAELEPQHAGILINLGNGYLKTRRLAQAAAVYERVARLRPESADVHAQLGLVYATMGNLDAASQSLATLRALSSPHAARLENLIHAGASAAHGESAPSR